jgi:hypothetical protein
VANHYLDLQIALGAGTDGGGRCVSIGKDGDGQVNHIVVVPGEIKQIEQALGQAWDVLGGIRKLDFVGGEQLECERGKTVLIQYRSVLKINRRVVCAGDDD